MHGFVLKYLGLRRFCKEPEDATARIYMFFNQKLCAVQVIVKNVWKRKNIY